MRALIFAIAAVTVILGVAALLTSGPNGASTERGTITVAALKV